MVFRVFRFFDHPIMGGLTPARKAGESITMYLFWIVETLVSLGFSAAWWCYFRQWHIRRRPPKYRFALNCLSVLTALAGGLGFAMVDYEMVKQYNLYESDVTVIVTHVEPVVEGEQTHCYISTNTGRIYKSDGKMCGRVLEASQDALVQLYIFRDDRLNYGKAQGMITDARRLGPLPQHNCRSKRR
jgi:hypothetical protein